MQLDKKKQALLFGAICVMVIGFLIFVFISQFGGGSRAPAEESVTATIPDGEVQKMSDSKSEAFRGRVSTEDYFAELGKLTEDEEISLVSSDGRPTPQTDSSPAMKQEQSDEAAVARTFGTPPPSSASSSAAPSRRSSGGGSSASRPMTEQERLDYDRRRAEMVRDVLVGSSEEATAETPAPEPQSIDLSAVGSSDGIISSLDDDFEDAAVQYEGAKRPFKCMFVRDQKITSGQRVTLRLLEDYNQDGVRIPANTHLAAICKIGDRLELQVRSLEMNGRIIPLALDAYDTDGLQGIYCPETSSQKNSHTATNDAISTAGTTFGGLVGDIASTVIRTGATIAKSASGEVSVSVVSGYEFYLVKAERR
ncbi:MAG: conjugative transposon protein TraM [Bacteroidales bacterium]|nr:conjugative transposon protein TraM [Bacteroidales bacterium]